jgi:hypothetical protein
MLHTLTLREAIADAFASVEKTDARIYFLHAGKAIYDQILRDEHFVSTKEACTNRLWGVEVVLDPKVPKNTVLLRYKRRIAPSPGRPLNEDLWCDPKVFGRYRKKVRLVFTRNYYDPPPSTSSDSGGPSRDGQEGCPGTKSPPTPPGPCTERNAG